MARIRSIKPEVRTSLKVAEWPREVRYFWVLLWGYLDDKGRGVDEPRLVRADCFPLDDDLSAATVDSWLAMIAASGPLCRYKVGNRRYMHAVNWTEHQRPSHPKPSRYPPCPHNHDEEPAEQEEQQPESASGSSPEDFAKSSGSPRAPLVPEQGAGSREMEQGAGSRRERAGAHADDEPPPPAGLERPGGLTSIGEFKLTDSMRRYASSTFPGLDVDFETAQFISHYRSTGARRKSWPDQWQKWLRDSAQRVSQRALRAAPATRPATTDARVAQAQALKALYADGAQPGITRHTIRGEITP